MISPTATSHERALSSYCCCGYNRIPVKHEMTAVVNRMLLQHFGISNMEQLLRCLGDDFRYVEPVYCGPVLRTFPDGSIEGYFGERYKRAEYEGGSYLEASYLPYAGIETLDRLDRSHFPSADWFDYSSIREQCESWNNQYALCFGTAGDMDFINTIARARGMEEVLMDLLEDNEVFIEIMKARFEFYYEMHRRVLEAAGGLIDFVHIGEDLGNQRGAMISKQIFERHFAPKFKQYFDMAHSYGARTMMHMCGCVESFLPRLIELGLDVQDVVQPTTPEMDIAYLHKHYADRLRFCGTACVQSTLAHGSVAEVEREVKRRLELFPKGGLFLGPPHAIQVGSPLPNILALYRTAGSLMEKADAPILAIAGGPESEKVNLSKLF